MVRVPPIALTPGCSIAAWAMGLVLFSAACDDGPLVSDDDDAPTPESVGSQRLDPWVRSETASPGSVTFTELHHHAPDGGPEWLELHNPMALDMDISGWRLEGAAEHTFAAGTVVDAGAYFVVDAELPDDGGRVDLRNQTGRRIDTVEYSDDDPWPVGPDGSGWTLAKRDADAASDHAEHWAVSAERGGTPGAPNGLDPFVPPTVVELVALEGSTWSMDLSGDPDPAWVDPDFDDAGRPVGEAVFYAGAPTADVPVAVTVTADNYFALYLGGPDGGDLRLVGSELDDAWTTVEDFGFDAGPGEHLYLAAWELPDWDGGPQMTIAEVGLPDAVLGTGAATFEWVLGPVDGAPATAFSAPPDEDEVRALVEAAEADGAWSAPAAVAARSSGPWGGAVGGAFTDAASYVWPDTFAATSVTNVDRTYALFRTVAPLGGGGGDTELPSVPTTSAFRTWFTLDADPAATDLTLECLVDDGAVVHLNGVEVLRLNMPEGPVDADTLAAAAVDQASRTVDPVPADALVRGDNLLAVEVHQAQPDDADLTFGCGLTARVGPSAPGGAPSIVLNELPPAARSPFWVELFGAGSGPRDTGGLVLASSAGDEFVLPDGEVASGEVLVLDDVGFAPAPDDVLFLYSADRETLLDAARVRRGLRGRLPNAGPWRSPRATTRGGANEFEIGDHVVIHEIHYDHEWIELYNRGAEPVDLGGAQLVDAVAFEFAAGTVLEPDAYLVVAGDAEAVQALHPSIDVLGDYDGRLDNRTDRIVLLDARGNPVDEVRYFDGGRWPEEADGGGSSLELRDPDADNASAEAWAASDEGRRSAWGAYSHRGPAGTSPVGPDGRWEELVLGLLDAGEVLLDDVSVIADPDGARVELIRDGGFDAADSWRLLGTHRAGEVVPDPDDAANPVLRLVAMGPTGHMHNHVETTLLQAVGPGEYEISFKARWMAGSNQLNSRLYFNRLARTTLVARPELSGTPGAPNSTAVGNLGPTFEGLRHDPAVPPAGEPVSVRVRVRDPDGVEAVTLWSSVGGAPFESQPMTAGPSGWGAVLEGRPAGTVVQVYVEAEDGAGASSTHPAAGADSRALIAFDDGLAATNGLPTLRIVMTEADAEWFHRDVNLMSNDLVGATVVSHEAEVFYDVGVRGKGSQRGRPRVPRLGFGVTFRRDQPFRGSHGSVMIDRSEGVGFGQREVLLNLAMTAAGSVSGEYNDVVHVIAPRSEHTGAAELQLDRFSSLVLGSQFENGAAGTRFEYELIYYPTTTDDGTAEGLKRPQPDQVVGTPITYYGDDKEAYRWNFLIKNNEREDDYGRLIDMCRVFWLPDDEFRAQADDVIDVDQWLRAFAFATLSGAHDQYGGAGSRHNVQFYVRPSDQRVLHFPHDMDFFGNARMPIVNNSDLARLIVDPEHHRAYYDHLRDIVETAYNGEYMARWCDQLGGLLPGQDFAGHCAFLAERADWVMNGAADAVNLVYPDGP